MTLNETSLGVGRRDGAVPGRVRLILIHGFACGPEDWTAQSSILQRDFEVVAVDLAASRAVMRRGRSLITEMARSVNGSKGATSSISVLVGHSMGCRIALEAARLDATGIKGLVLIEGSLRAAGDAGAAVASYLSHTPQENKRRLRDDFVGMFSDATAPSFRAFALQRLEAMDAEYATELMADMTRWDAGDAPGALRDVRAPMLVLQSTYKEPGGQRRAIRPQEMSPWLRLIEDQAGNQAEIVRLGQAGHFPQIETPELVNELIRSFVHKVACRSGSRHTIETSDAG